MGVKRAPFQGVYNIIRFNWDFYLLAGMLLCCLAIAVKLAGAPFCYLGVIAFLAIVLVILISLLVSFYVYDISNLYDFPWLTDKKEGNERTRILNIHAGFDESSAILKTKFRNIDLEIADFYDENRHTEASIRRARKLFPPAEETICITTNQLNFNDAQFDTIVAFFSLHEIRDMKERDVFLKELMRILKPGAKLYITEHLRDVPNFLAYNIGFLHFYSRSNWLTSFSRVGLKIVDEIKTTSFVSTFILEKDGIKL